MSDAVARLNAALEGLMALLLASILLLLPGCGGDDSTGPSGPTVVSIAVEGPPGAVTSVGEAGPFFATASLSDGTSQDVTAEAKWTSSDPSVVTVSATGAGEAVGVGQSEICATYQGVSGCVLVTVTAPVAISIAVEGPPGAVTSVGESGPFIAVATFSDGTTKDVTSEAAWTSSNTSVITISATGQGQAVGVGQSEICAMYQGVSGCVLVTVTAP